MARYIKCDCCGEKIRFGSVVIHHDYCGAYCSDECYASATGCCATLNNEVAENLDCTVYDDERRIAEIREAMEKLQNELQSLLA